MIEAHELEAMAGLRVLSAYINQTEFYLTPEGEKFHRLMIGNIIAKQEERDRAEQSVMMREQDRIKEPRRSRRAIRSREDPARESKILFEQALHFILNEECYVKEAKAIVEGKNWQGKNKCVKLAGDE